MTTQNQHQLDFQLPVLKEQLTGHAVIMDSCLFLWIGQAKTEFLLFGHNNHSMFIDGIPSPNNQVFLQSVCTKLCKVFPDKQIYFSTDIGGDAKDPKYWMKFFESLKHHIDSNKQFYRLS